MNILMKSLPNSITLLRIILVCIANLYIFNNFSSMIVPIMLASLIYITDYFDGKIARFYGCTSKLGAVLDVIADLFYIVVSYIVLYKFNLLPLWFLFIIIAKFMEFIITSFFLKKSNDRKIIFVFDIIGKFVAVIFYIIPIFTYISFHMWNHIYFFIVHIFIFIIAFLATISSIHRIKNCISLYKVFNIDTCRTLE